MPLKYFMNRFICGAIVILVLAGSGGSTFGQGAGNLSENPVYTPILREVWRNTGVDIESFDLSKIDDIYSKETKWPDYELNDNVSNNNGMEGFIYRNPQSVKLNEKTWTQILNDSSSGQFVVTGLDYESVQNYSKSLDKYSVNSDHITTTSYYKAEEPTEKYVVGVNVTLRNRAAVVAATAVGIEDWGGSAAAFEDYSIFRRFYFTQDGNIIRGEDNSCGLSEKNKFAEVLGILEENVQAIFGSCAFETGISATFSDYRRYGNIEKIDFKLIADISTANFGNSYERIALMATGIRLKPKDSPRYKLPEVGDGRSHIIAAFRKIDAQLSQYARQKGVNLEQIE